MKHKSDKIHNISSNIQLIWDTIDLLSVEESEILHLMRSNISCENISKIINQPQWYVNDLIARALSSLYEKLFNERINDTLQFVSLISEHDYSQIKSAGNTEVEGDFKNLVDLMLLIQTLTDRPLPAGITRTPLEKLTGESMFSTREDKKTYRKRHAFLYAGSVAAVVLAITTVIFIYKGKNTAFISAGVERPVFTALNEGNISKLSSLLEKKSNVNIVDENGYTPLHIACSKGYTDAARLLLRSGADVNAVVPNGLTPLQIAVNNGNTDIIGLLINANADLNKFSENDKAPVHVASVDGYNGLPQINAYINTANPAVYTPLCIAAMKGRTDIVKLLLLSKAEIDMPVQVKDPLMHDSVYSITPLYAASEKGYTDIVKLLINANADVNTVSRFGYTPLHIASANNHPDIVRLLLSSNVDVNATTIIGYTPLYIASKRGYTEIVKLLLQSGADVNFQSKNGYTPLYIASKKGYTDIIKLLLEYNASVNPMQNNMFSEDFESYPTYINIHYYQNPTIWQTVGKHTQSVFIAENYDNKYAVINFDSNSHAWLSFGFVQKIDHYWNPPEDLSKAVISFDIASDLDNPITNVLSAAVMTAGGEVYRLPNTELKTIPGRGDGWVTMTFKIDEFVLNNKLDVYDQSFDPSKVISIQILAVQNINRFVAKGKVYLDNIVVKESVEDE